MQVFIEIFRNIITPVWELKNRKEITPYMKHLIRAEMAVDPDVCVCKGLIRDIGSTNENIRMNPFEAKTK